MRNARAAEPKNLLRGRIVEAGGDTLLSARVYVRSTDGKWYYFCSMACRQRFIANPARYLAPGKQA